ncbi:MAG: cation:dicarboxylate symporter family transporter [Candidatus Kapaibacteriales bacterium]
MVLQSVGVPTEGIALILGVDRILDMMRTVFNIGGDSVVSLCVARMESNSMKPL